MAEFFFRADYDNVVPPANSFPISAISSVSWLVASPWLPTIPPLFVSMDAPVVRIAHSIVNLRQENGLKNANNAGYALG